MKLKSQGLTLWLCVQILLKYTCLQNCAAYIFINCNANTTLYALVYQTLKEIMYNRFTSNKPEYSIESLNKYYSLNYRKITIDYLFNYNAKILWIIIIEIKKTCLILTYYEVQRTMFY